MEIMGFLTQNRLGLRGLDVIAGTAAQSLCHENIVKFHAVYYERPADPAGLASGLPGALCASSWTSTPEDLCRTYCVYLRCYSCANKIYAHICTYMYF